MNNYRLKILRLKAIIIKELIIMRRDYPTLIFLILLPFSQLLIFGNIINTDARHLPTIIVNNDHSIFTSSLISGFKNTDYFKIISIRNDVKKIEDLMKKSKVKFIITIPNNFSKDIINNKHPHLLVEGDGTDPVAVGKAFRTITELANTVLDKDLTGPLSYLKKIEPIFHVDIHSLYNPSMLSKYQAVLGLLVTILAISLIMLTAISITTEFEHRTIEVLFMTPIKPLELILGKLITNLFIGIIVYFLVITVSIYYFYIPFLGSYSLLLLCAVPYMMTNLSIGLAASTVSRSPVRAINITSAYILPTILLSGFLFPFEAMPQWAQWLGELLPSTHFMRITMQIMLKKSTFINIWSDLWPMLLFLVLMLTFSMKRFQETLD